MNLDLNLLMPIFKTLHVFLPNQNCENGIPLDDNLGQRTTYKIIL